jgi:hypothetical protein
MGIQQFIRDAFRGSLTIFDAELVDYGGNHYTGVVAEDQSGLELEDGGDRIPRSLTVEFPAGTFPRRPRDGQPMMVRGKSWQIADVNAGQAVVRIALREDNK